MKKYITGIALTLCTLNASSAVSASTLTEHDIALAQLKTKQRSVQSCLENLIEEDAKDYDKDTLIKFRQTVECALEAFKVYSPQLRSREDYSMECTCLMNDTIFPMMFAGEPNDWNRVKFVEVITEINTFLGEYIAMNP